MAEENISKMTVKEFYELVGADYEGAVSRLMKDDRIEKYLGMFAEGGHFEAIRNNVLEENWKEAFRAVHNLKGVSMTMGFTELYEACNVLCEELRPCVKPEADIWEMVDAISNQYNKVIRGLESALHM